MPNCSLAASAAGTSGAAGMRMRRARANRRFHRNAPASRSPWLLRCGPHRTLQAATVATFSPACARANCERHSSGSQFGAGHHGRKRIQDVMLRFFYDLVGSARRCASLMYALNVPITELPGSAACTVRLGKTAAAPTPPRLAIRPRLVTCIVHVLLRLDSRDVQFNPIESQCAQ